MTQSPSQQAAHFEKPQWLNPKTGCYEDCIPEPFYYGLLPWIWKRLMGWRDEYGRKAQLVWQWPEGPEND